MKSLRSSLLWPAAVVPQTGGCNSDAPKSKRDSLWLFLLAGLFLSFSSSPATASTILFSNLGSAGNVYNDSSAQAVCGNTAFLCSPNSFAIADAFTVSGSGSQTVTQIDVAVGNLFPSQTFEVSIWTDVDNAPGAMVPNAVGTLVSTPATTCCSNLVTAVATGIDLTGGSTYFMIISPESISDDSANEWFDNSIGATGLALMSQNGGPWSSIGTTTLQAFDVIGNASVGTPEPGTLLLFGTGALAMLFATRRKRAIKSIGQSPIVAANKPGS
jgi:hypothetical protein